MDIHIDPEFAKLIPPLSEAERTALEESLVAAGCRDALVVWKETGTLLDGHNRHNICTRHHLVYRIQELSFADKDEAMAWVIDNQLARRNLAPDALRYLRGKKYMQNKLSHGGDRASGQVDHLKTSEGLAKQWGVGEKTIRRDEKFAKTLDRNPDLKEKILSGETTYNKVRQEIRRAKVMETLQETPLPQQKHRLFYADPPWQYGSSGLDDYGHAERHYPTMSIEELCALPVKEMAGDDAVLFLWATSPLLPDALQVMEAWGFKYKTSFVWDKVKHNFGYYNSVRHELLLVGTKGSCLPDVKELVDSVVSIERGRHSEKPVYFRELIERLYTSGRRIELFARRATPGWECWGNQLEGGK